MVNRDVLRSRIELINNHLNRILPYKGLSYEDFLKDMEAQDIVEYNFFQIVNHLISLTEHIVVDEDYGLPQTPYEAAMILRDKGVLDKGDLVLLRKMIGFRNVIGHDYVHLNKEIVYSLLKSGQKDVGQILTRITGKFF